MFEPVPLNKPEFNKDNLMAYLVYQRMLFIPIKYSFYFEQYCKSKNIGEDELRKELGISPIGEDKNYKVVSNMWFNPAAFSKEPENTLFYSSVITYQKLWTIIKEANSTITGLLQTTNYNQFSGYDTRNPLQQVNRKDIHFNIGELKKALAKHEVNLLEFFPIGVNSNLEIITGENIFIAAKELGLDIYYTIIDDFLIDKLKMFYEIGHYYGKGIGSTPKYFQKSIKPKVPIRLSWDNNKSNYSNKDYHGFNQDAIDSAFEGDAENCWNVD